MYALERHTETLMKILWQVVHSRMKKIGSEHWETAGWVVIAFDGSRDANPPPNVWIIKLWRARTDCYDRKGSKAARYRPPNPDKKPLGDPKIRLLTEKEKIKLKAINSAKITA